MRARLFAHRRLILVVVLLAVLLVAFTSQSQPHPELPIGDEWVNVP
jgi:hypothetical protein